MSHETLSDLSLVDRTETRKTLLSLLKSNRDKFHIEYEGFLSNHLSHALTALYHLGASSSRLHEFYNKYTKKLEPKKPSYNLINKNNWNLYTGLDEHYSDYLDFFLDEIRNKGRKYLINEYFPALSHGVAGGAFHGLITLGWALEADCDETVAQGMAYLAVVHLPLGTLNPQGVKKDPLQILKEVKEHTELNVKSLFGQYYKEHNKPPGFQTRMKTLREKYGSSLLQEFDLYMDESGNEEYVQDFLRTLSQITCEGFANSGYRDFFMLHGVTSYRSLKMVLHNLNRTSDKIIALKHYWRAFVCAYVAQGSIDIFIPEKYYNLPLSWPHIIKPAIKNDEEHLIKIVYVCKREEEEFGKVLDRDLYRDVAAKALALVEMYGLSLVLGVMNKLHN